MAKVAARIVGTRQRYTPEFKAMAVALVAGGQHITSTARSRGIVDSTLGTWVRMARDAQALAMARTPAAPEPSQDVQKLAAEVAELRTRLAQVERERNALRVSVAAITGAMS